MLEAESTTQESTESSGNSALWSDVWRRMAQNRMALIGMVALIIISSLCILAPWIAPYGYEQQDLMLGAAGPSSEHWFGTDVLGRDLMTRVLFGWPCVSYGWFCRDYGGIDHRSDLGNGGWLCRRLGR